MQYSVGLTIEGINNDCNFWIYGSYLPGLIVPERVLEMMIAIYVDENMDICKKCVLGEKNHIIRDDGRKYCIILFHDAFKPNWKIKDLT